MFDVDEDLGAEPDSVEGGVVFADGLNTLCQPNSYGEREEKKKKTPQSHHQQH